MFALIMMSCEPKYNFRVIVSKSYLTGQDKPMPEGICRYQYQSGWGLDKQFVEFQDSCFKYCVGDTLNWRAKK